MTQRRIYQQEHPYFITFRTREGWPAFEDREMAGLMADIIFNAGRLKWFDVLAYQIMPDHVHVLVYRMDGNAGGDTRVREVQNFHALPPQVSAPAVIIKSAPVKENNVSQLMYCIKSYFIKRIRVQYNIPYSIWHTRFYTRIVDTQQYLHTVIHYIQYNPVKAKLPEKYQKFPYQYFDWRLISKL
ncbi:MAG: transposase [Patescibacteria group bacterium]